MDERVTSDTSCNFSQAPHCDETYETNVQAGRGTSPKPIRVVASKFFSKGQSSTDLCCDHVDSLRSNFL